MNLANNMCLVRGGFGASAVTICGRTLKNDKAGPAHGGLLSVPAPDSCATFDLRIHTIFHLCRAVVPSMRRRGERAIPQFTTFPASELADHGIRSPFQDFLIPEQTRSTIENRITLHSEGKPEDVAAAIPRPTTGDFITGEYLAVEGEMTMRVA